MKRLNLMINYKSLDQKFPTMDFPIDQQLRGALVDRILAVLIGLLRRFCCGERFSGGL